MVHTFEIYTYISLLRAGLLLDELEASEAMRFVGPGNVNGITKLSIFPRGDNFGYILKLIVNPAKLLYGYDAFETMDVDLLPELATAFASALSEALGYEDFPDLLDWLVHRIDFAVDVYTEHPREYLLLFDKGDKPKSYKERYSGRDGSCYWECKSTTANVYYKADQMAREGKSPELIERAKNLIRFEVQCKSPKVTYLRKKFGLEGRRLSELFTRDCAEAVLTTYCRRVFKTGDYYSRTEAGKRMKALGLSTRQQRACDNILRAIAQTRSISAARQKITTEGIMVKNTIPVIQLNYSVEQFGRNCKKLSDSGINPVTIPRDWNIDYLPGIYSLLHDRLGISFDSTTTKLA